MTDRLSINQINSDQLDQLYDQLAAYETALGRVRRTAATRSFMAGPNAVDVVRVTDVLSALDPQETP